MTKFARMIDVLDLYSEVNTLLSAEDIAERLQVSRPTAFRYARELSAAGFLANYGGRYSLGARIITLDYRIRESDPVIRAARSPMQQLAAETSYGVALCRMYNEEVINVHHELGYDHRASNFARGRPLPLFRGAASKILLAHLSVKRLKRLYDRHRDDPDLKAIAEQWPAFRAYYAAIRQRGHYESHEEIESDVIAIAAPVSLPGSGVVAALILILSRQRLEHVNPEGLAALVARRAHTVSAALYALADPNLAIAAVGPDLEADIETEI